MTNFMKNLLDTTAKSVADQVAKWYNDAPIYAYCDMYEFNCTQDSPTSIPVTWVSEGTDDFAAPKFKEGFERFCKKAGLDWRVQWWCVPLGKSLSDKGRQVYKTTIVVSLDEDALCAIHALK
jgi:hypothetical protein